MHDPSTLAFSIPPHKPGRDRDPIITIWHCDPEADGSDDSCGWFKRARHGDPKVLKRIQSDFEFNWDSDHGAWFNPYGDPCMSTGGIVLDMFWTAAVAHYGNKRGKTRRFIQRNLADILHFAENPVDSLHPLITSQFGLEKRDARIRQAASCVYGCILRWEQPWWKHPRWHFWHWRVQFHPWQNLRRALRRCDGCGERFGRRASVVQFGNDLLCRTCTAARYGVEP